MLGRCVPEAELGRCVPEGELGQSVPWPVPWALGSLPAAGVVTVQKALCLAALARSDRRHGQTGCGLGGSRLPAAMALVFRRLERPRPLQPQKLRGLGGESWPDAGRPRSAEPTTRTLNYGGLG